jgi:cholesterol oxidase
MDADVIIIGSGFGGSVMACRLAEAGARVLVLERGRRWDRTNYPSVTESNWWWSHDDPAAWNGWMDLRAFPHMAVAQGAAVGGGSLIYANISAVPHKDIFTHGWPQEITYDALAPHYATVGREMNVQTVPDNQWPARTKLMRDAAEKIGAGDRFMKLELAVSFDEDFSYDRPDPFSFSHSKPFTNAQGVVQGTCVHCGNCDIGCPADARNTLDRTYLARAETKGAEVRPLHLVTSIAQEANGWRVDFDRLENGIRQPGSATARIVIVAAGSLNSTELLLRCRDMLGTLPQLSQTLGHNWSSNGDFLTPAFYTDRKPNPTQGPTITSAIDFLDRSQGGQSFWIEDGGFPNLLANMAATATSAHPQAQLFLTWLRESLQRHGGLDHVMPWFAQGVDAGDGRLYLRRKFEVVGPWELSLDWDITRSRPVMDAIVSMHEKLSHATGGIPLVPPTWSLAHYLVTPHPLGGCNMGTNAADGVVDHAGEVFNYRNLFVLDGAIVPEAVGVNPSRTIAALAERAAALLVDSGRL